MKRKINSTSDDEDTTNPSASEMHESHLNNDEGDGPTAAAAAAALQCQQTALEIVLYNKCLPWHDAMKLGRANKVLYRVWNDKVKNSQLEELLQELVKIVDLEENYRRHRRNDSVQDPRSNQNYDGLDVETKCKGMTQFIAGMVRNFHRHFDFRNGGLADPDRLPFPLARLHERAMFWNSEDEDDLNEFWVLYPNRAAFALSLAYLSKATFRLTDGYDLDQFSARHPFMRIEFFDHDILGMVETMFPFQDWVFERYIRHSYPSEKSRLILGPLLPKVFLRGPLWNTTGSSDSSGSAIANLPQGLEPVVDQDWIDRVQSTRRNPLRFTIPWRDGPDDES